jgi:hypothetical protein
MPLLVIPAQVRSVTASSCQPGVMTIQRVVLLIPCGYDLYRLSVGTLDDALLGVVLRISGLSIVSWSRRQLSVSDNILRDAMLINPPYVLPLSNCPANNTALPT